jgi:hypothetical protein
VLCVSVLISRGHRNSLKAAYAINGSAVSFSCEQNVCRSDPTHATLRSSMMMFLYSGIIFFIFFYYLFDKKKGKLFFSLFFFRVLKRAVLSRVRRVVSSLNQRHRIFSAVVWENIIHRYKIYLVYPQYVEFGVWHCFFVCIFEIWKSWK